MGQIISKCLIINVSFSEFCRCNWQTFFFTFFFLRLGLYTKLDIWHNANVTATVFYLDTGNLTGIVFIVLNQRFGRADISLHTQFYLCILGGSNMSMQSFVSFESDHLSLFN